MNNLHNAVQASHCIQSLASKAVEKLSASHPAYKVALECSKNPVGYMRFAEFDAILKLLDLKSSLKILDISSPQWFSIFLAYSYPQIEIEYINIIDRELDPFIEIANVLHIKNLTYTKADVREMRFQDNSFDKVISISVIEHIYPEMDGDIIALNEIKRVLKPVGEFLMTVPYKSKSNIIYTNGEVYERSKKSQNFYAREYDEVMFHQLVEHTGFSCSGSFFICEKKGIFAEDYHTWGPGKNRLLGKYLIKIRQKLESITGIPLTSMIARNYLKVTPEATHRLVNIAVKLKNIG